MTQRDEHGEGQVTEAEVRQLLRKAPPELWQDPLTRMLMELALMACVKPKQGDGGEREGGGER